tara:strand:- start:3290 stop:4030 length:741 start_codon:yes stop_codon:yes gene_type:complete
MQNTILCVKWGDKYGNEYVEKLKEQVENNCSVPFNFYCLTDKPTQSYDIQLPTIWDAYENGKFWAYRKLYMFNERVADIKGDQFLYLDLDVIIQRDLKYFFELNMERPYIVKGWWNDIEVCKKNYAKFQSPMVNSSVIRWNRAQLQKVYKHINDNLDVIFFTYPTIDNYLNHFWYNMHEETRSDVDRSDKSFLNVFPKGDIYSWYKGNIFPDDMEPKKKRQECKICLFNNSGEDNDVEELKILWNT